MSIEKLIESKLARLEEQKKQAKKRKEEQSLNPMKIMARDQRVIKKELKKWEISKEIAEKQIKKLKELQEKLNEAIQFYNNASSEIKEALSVPTNWKNFPELSYVNEFSAIF